MKLTNLFESYLAVFSIGLKNTLAYKTDFILSLFSSFFEAGLMIFIWTAIYHFTDVGSILGITLPSMYAYFFLVSAFMFIINMDLPLNMQSDIQGGAVAVAYTRPLRYPMQVFFKTVPSDILSFFILTIPLLIIAILLSHASLSVLVSLLVVAELAIGYALISLIGFMIGMLAIKMVNITGIVNSLWSLILLIGGGVVPLTLFPHVITGVLMLTPLPIMLYLPAATFLGMVSSSAAIGYIWINLAWLLGLAAVTALAWRSTRRKITSAGG